MHTMETMLPVPRRMAAHNKSRRCNGCIFLAQEENHKIILNTDSDTSPPAPCHTEFSTAAALLHHGPYVTQTNMRILRVLVVWKRVHNKHFRREKKSQNHIERREDAPPSATTASHKESSTPRPAALHHTHGDKPVDTYRRAHNRHYATAWLHSFGVRRKSQNHIEQTNAPPSATTVSHRVVNTGGTSASPSRRRAQCIWKVKELLKHTLVGLVFFVYKI